MLFGLFGTFVAVEGQREALTSKLLKVGELMESVPACLLYVVSTSAAQPDLVSVTEIWKDESAHGASLSMPGVRDLIQSTMPLVASVPESTRFTPAGGKGLARLTGSS
jgi:quinol monooxygenase YgiN